MCNPARLRHVLAALQEGICTAGQLARETGAGRRTIYRDIAFLRTIGFNVRGEAGIGYMLRLPKPASAPDPLRQSLKDVRSNFHVEYGAGRAIRLVGHSRRALPRVIRILDAALAMSGGANG